MAIVSRQLENLKPGATYTVQVRAVSNENSSEWSNAYTFTTPTANVATTNTKADIKLDGGSIYSGTKNPLTGVLMNKDGLFGYKNGTTTFSITSSTGDAVFAGSVVAASGTIGGWSIAPSALYAGTGSNYVAMSTGSYPFWAGAVDPASAKFSVTNAGVLSASGGIFTNGTFSGGQITGTSINVGSGKFVVDSSGNLQATGASISGNISASSGSFSGSVYAQTGSFSGSVYATTGSFSGSVYATDGEFKGTIKSGTVVTGAISASSATIDGATYTQSLFSSGSIVGLSINIPTASAPTFRVTTGGALTATSASITGQINATSGSFTGDVFISSPGRLVAGTTGSTQVVVTSTGITGTSSGIPVFTLPSDGSAPTIGGFQVVKTGLITADVVTTTISGASGQSTITVTSNNELFIGMSASGTGIGSGALITGISGTTISLSVANTGTVSGTGTFTPNSNLIVGNTTNNITIRGQNAPGTPPAIFTRISNVATTENSGNGFYIDQSGKFRLAGANGLVSMDGSGNLSVSGSISANAGYIGSTANGWVIASDAIKSSDLGIVLQSSNSSSKIYSGNTGSYNDLFTPFYVDSTGKFSLKDKLYFDGTNLSVSGSITAASGNIGGWSIGSNLLSNSNVGLSAPSSPTSTDIAIYAGDTFANRAIAPFRVNYGGSVTATNASITGTINSTSGNIGGWTLASSNISSSTSSGQMKIWNSYPSTSSFTEYQSSPAIEVLDSSGNTVGLLGRYTSTVDFEEGIVLAGKTTGSKGTRVTLGAGKILMDSDSGIFLGTKSSNLGQLFINTTSSGLLNSNAIFGAYVGASGQAIFSASGQTPIVAARTDATGNLTSFYTGPATSGALVYRGRIGYESASGMVFESTTNSASGITINAQSGSIRFVSAGTIDFGTLSASSYQLKSTVGIQLVATAGNNITLTSGNNINLNASGTGIVDFGTLSASGNKLGSTAGIQIVATADNNISITSGSNITLNASGTGYINLADRTDVNGALTANKAMYGSASVYSYNAAATGRPMYIDTSGNSYRIGAQTSSTKRVKQQINNYEWDINKILSLEPKRFKYNKAIEDLGNEAPWSYGFIAEEADELGLEWLIGRDEGGIPDYFAYEKMPVVLHSIIRQQQEQIKSLEQRIADLESKVI